MKVTKSLKALHDLGFALHWLHKKSKRPTESEWSSGPRKPWAILKASHDDQFNVGVRLGKASKIGDRYLAVIDCDVKSEDPKHVKEMLSKLKEFFGAKPLSSYPVVMSGRGNGSMHVYFLTDKPMKPQRLSQSSEKVRVHMPSIDKVSKADRAALTDKEIAKGYRFRAAWEISLMGDGQQVVLPPSIHPDSGKAYAWDGGQPTEIPTLNLTLKDTKDFTSDSELKRDWKPVPVDLTCSKLSDYTINAIVDGTGVEDRSASLLGVANQMLKCGFTDDEILTVLTDPANALGEVAYEHAQTQSRARAARWVKRYTLDKSKAETLAESVFDDDVAIDDIPLLDTAAQAEQVKAITDEKDWFDLIERGPEETGSKPKNTLKNVILILQGEGGVDVFKRDEFANRELYGRRPPWSVKTKIGDELTDTDTVRIKTWLADNYRFEPSNDRINEAVCAIADKNRFHPVREYLTALPAWDGTPRIDTWLRDYLSAEAPEPYLSAISRKVLVAMIKRIQEPGCKFDQVLILEGDQGVGKSTAVRMLASDLWFSDAHINISDKDAVLSMESIWVIELGELSGMRKADVDQLKEFISRTTDRIRVPYGKRTEKFPRQCIFIGTTNSREYLKDPTGNRRFWPVKVGDCDFKRVKRDRDQLLAEALFAYELGEPLYLEDAGMVTAAIQEQESRAIADSWDDMIEDWLAKNDDEDEIGPKVSRERFTILELFSDFGPLADWKPNQPELKRAGESLRKLGFERYTAKLDGRTKKVWEPKRTNPFGVRDL